MSRAAVFLDKDGTLVKDVPYNVDPALVQLAPGVDEGAAALHEADFLLVVVSNQSGIARGFFPEVSIAPMKRCLEMKLAEAGAPIAGFYYCPHHPQGAVAEYAIECECRKPRPGMLLQAAIDLEIDLARSWLIGDILDDIEAAKAAGCRAVLLNNGHETEWATGGRRVPEFIASDFAGAAKYILAHHRCVPLRERGRSRGAKGDHARARPRPRRAIQGGILPGLFAFPPLFSPRRLLAASGRHR
jgi:D,D-heptose 1,7-bisphosphate phosphatase